jgi:hypothetical protein
MKEEREPSGDFVEADQYQLDELRAAAFGESTSLSRQLAVALLGRKEYPNKVDDLERLLANEDEEPRLRIMAATELGRMGTPPAVERLSAALEVREPRVLQSVVDAAAATGDPEALRRVRTLRRRTQESLAGAADWGAQLLALKSGGRSRPLPAPPKRSLMSVNEKRAEPAKVRKLDDAAAERVIADVSAGLLKLDLSTRSALRARCGPRDLALLFTRPFLEDVPAALRGRTIALAVTELDHVEYESWEVRYLVVAQPTAGEIELHALSVSGELAFFGQATLRDDGSVEFSMQSVDRPDAVPAVLAGTFADGRLRIERFESEPTGRRRVSPGIQRRSLR